MNSKFQKYKLSKRSDSRFIFQFCWESRQCLSNRLAEEWNLECTRRTTRKDDGSRGSMYSQLTASKIAGRFFKQNNATTTRSFSFFQSVHKKQENHNGQSCRVSFCQAAPRRLCHHRKYTSDQKRWTCFCSGLEIVKILSTLLTQGLRFFHDLVVIIDLYIHNKVDGGGIDGCVASI